MKKLFLLLVFSIGFCNAQYLIDDNDISENLTENGKSQIAFDLKSPLEFYRLKCLNATYAQFPGGENAFKNEFQKEIEQFFQNSLYYINGTFDFVFSIDKNGNLQKFDLKPEVANSNFLRSDLNSTLQKIGGKWLPATCENVPVDSKVRLRVDFRTEGSDL